MGKEQSKGDFPSVDLYKEHPEADRLRSIILGMAGNVDRLMYDPLLEENEEARREAEEELRRQQQEVRSLGVVPNIHLTRDKTNKFGHPIRIAEDLAGVWLTHLTDPILSQTRVVGIVRDYLKTHSEDDIDEAPPEEKRFMRLNKLVGITFKVLDAEDLLAQSEKFIQDNAGNRNQIFTQLILDQRRRASIYIVI